MAITSPSKGIIEVNDELCRILGYEREELLQKTWPAMTHSEDLATEVAQFKRVVGGKIDGYSLEKRWIRKDGRVIYSIMSAKCERRADGSIDYFVGLVLDITERKRAEDEQSKLALLVENSNDFIGMASPEGAVLYVNSAGQKLVGLNGSEAAGATHITDYLMEEESDRFQKEILPAVERTGAWQGEVRFRHFETGAAIAMLMNTFVIHGGRSGRPSVLATISRDITEIQRTEEELRRTAAYLAEGQRLSHTASWAWNAAVVEYVGTTIDETERILAEKLRRSEAHLAEAQRIGQVGSWIWNAATRECFWSREHFCIFGLDADTFKPTKVNTQRFIHREDLPFVEATLQK